MKMLVEFNNKKLCKALAGYAVSIPRCYWSKAKNKKSPKVLIKCGCCDEKFKIYLMGKEDDLIELGGVIMNIKWLRKFLNFIETNRKELNNGKEIAK